MRMKLCARCQKVIEVPNRYCEECRSVVEKQIIELKQKTNSRYNKNRDSKYTKFYNSKEWRTLSKTYLKKHKLCEECLKEMTNVDESLIPISEEVHHIDPIQNSSGWLRRFDWNNLIALCHMHHDIKHGRFKGKKK